MKLAFALLIAVLLHSPIEATLSKSDKKRHKPTASNLQSSSPVSTLVTERGLVTERPNYKQILQSHNAYSAEHAHVKLFPHATLAYVTPWHSRGYDHAKTFTAKFSILSPVWLQLRPDRNFETGFVITGGHDIDNGWMADARSNNKKIRIIPRVIFEGWTSQDFHKLFTNQYTANGCAQTVLQFLQQRGFDGAVIEVWSMLGGHTNRELTHFVTHLGRDLHSAGLLLILVIPPTVINGQASPIFGKTEFDALINAVDYFSLMTYDYAQNSQARDAAVNAPIGWMRDCVKALVPNDNDVALRAKILLGLSFYGYDYVPGNAEPVIGNKYLEILKKHQPSFMWSNQHKEHLLEYTTGIGSHIVTYPTLASIQARVSLAKSLGTGISIWEIGQGLDYFFDLL